MILDGIYWWVLGIAAFGCWLVPREWRSAFIACVSLGYITYLSPTSAALITVMAFSLFPALPRLARRNRAAVTLLLGIWCGLGGLLVAFKWSDHYGVSEIDGSVWRNAVPLGLSYYTFRFIHLAMEAYKSGRYPETFAGYCAYVFLFPIFPAGPIQRYDVFEKFRTDDFCSSFIRDGVTRIAIGLIKLGAIVHLVEHVRNRFTGVVQDTPVYEQLEALSGPLLWLFLAAFYFGAYLNLGAYTDIAIGASRLLGLRISENFEYPIFACNLTDFWRRWHMTLSGWCRDYVFSPAFGLTRNPYFALFLSFQVMGLWHVLSLNRMAWGLYHAAGLIAVLFWKKRYRHTPSPRWNWLRRFVAWLVTQSYVTASFLFVINENSNDVAASMKLILRLFTFGSAT